MTYWGICSSCQYGDHEHHIPVMQAVPPGVIGGAKCRCEGECVDGRYQSEQFKKIKETLAPILESRDV